MEQLLLKLARQLDAMDEASLMALWEKYAQIVQHFEPSERWQEAVLVLSFIQGKRWKNQLFNTQWAARTRAAAPGNDPGLPPHSAFTLEKPGASGGSAGVGTPPRNRRAKVLAFEPRSTDA